MKIVGIQNSPKKDKRYRVVLDDGKFYDFGLLNGSTYIDHNDDKKRMAYIARHFANRLEKNLIENLIPSPALFSIFLLWGRYKTLEENIHYLNSLFRKMA
jgi:hypothetical protein